MTEQAFRAPPGIITAGELIDRLRALPSEAQLLVDDDGLLRTIISILDGSAFVVWDTNR